MNTFNPLLTLGFFQSIGWMEMAVIMVLLLLLFGRRLPEVGKSLGRGIVEFKKGVKGIDEDVERQSNQPSPPAHSPWQQQAQLPPAQTAPPMPPPQQNPMGQPSTVSRADRAD